MNANLIFNRIELSFWDIIIPLMSNSSIFRRCFRGVYTLTRSNQSLAWISVVVITWASLGLLAGFFLGRMGASLW